MRTGWTAVRAICMAPLALLAMNSAKPSLPANVDASAIVQRSVEANQRDWNADPEYSYSETVRTGSGSKTYDVIMLFGSPYRRLLRVNGKPLSPGEQAGETKKFNQAVNERRSESPDATAKRIAAYEKDRRRDHLMMEQLTRAFTFRITGQARLSNRAVYVLSATPRSGYQPPNTESKVLTGMRGTMWIDTQTCQWVQVRAEVISPVSIEGFLARVDPGTLFVLQKSPVSSDVWLPKHFMVRSSAHVLGMFHHQTYEEDTFFNYRKTPAEYLRPARR